MVALTVAASIVLTAVFVVKKRQMKARGGKLLAFHFLDKSLDFLIPFTIIGSLFLLLSLFVSGTSDQTTIQRLIFFEKLVGFFKWFVSLFKIEPLVAIGLLIMFYLLSLTRIPSKYTSKLVPFFKKMQKIVKPVYMVFIILFSFTFFGTQAGAPSAKIRFRINEAEGKYGDLRQEVEQSVSREVARKLLEKVKDALPKDYRDDLDEQNQYYIIVTNLRQDYQAFKDNYDRSDPVAEIFTRPPPPDSPPSPRDGGDPPDSGGSRHTNSPTTSDKGPKKVSDKTPDSRASNDFIERRSETSLTGKQLVYDLFEENARGKSLIEPVPLQTSAKTISEATESVRTLCQKAQAEAIKILQSEHGHEIAVQLPETFTGKVKDTVFKALTDRYPILEPIVEAFFGAFDKELEIRTQKAVDRATRALSQDPTNTARIIGQEASGVVAETQIKTPSLLLSKALQVGDALRKRAQGIRDAIARLKMRAQKFDEYAEAVQSAEEQIELLSCRNEESRKAAAAKLATVSSSLTEDQVQRIESLLDDYSTRLGKSIKKPNYYEEVPVQYYAALTVQKMRSQYLTEGVKERAANIINDVNNRPLRDWGLLPAAEVDSLGLTDP
jgi:hypothetical protein